MGLEIEKEALKREKDDISKTRLKEIEENISILRKEEQEISRAWEEEKRINENK